ncbi:hypothetical protein [Ramlibacter sp. PS4R-6]|uniref:hypothetical protein n=1 Tax=Ramlibacter sp. PS4R-6 TaxID=3133438 RepID=UPI0030A49B7B
MTRATRNHLRRLALRLVCAATGAVFLGIVGHHVYTMDFEPLAALCLPFLVIFFGFTSLLYMRGRSLGRGRESLRTLFAAERAMQGAVFYVSGVVLGVSFYGLFRYMGFEFDAARPDLHGLWLLLFFVPYWLMQRGFFMFLTAVWIIVPQLLHPVSSYELWRRVARQP